MPNWILTPDGRLLNFQDARSVVQNGSSLTITRADGSEDTIPYGSATAALAGLTAIQGSLQQGDLGFGTQLVGVQYVTPSTVAHGAPAVAVLVGSGFSLSISTTVFHGTVTIGVDTISDPNLVYVNNNTLLLQWTPTNAGTFDVVYKDFGGVHTYTITNGITIT